MEIKIPDFTKLTWQLNVAIIAAVFTVFSLIYNEKYIYYGLFTFAYGVIGASILPALENLLPGNKWRNYLVVQSILPVLWIAICMWFGFSSMRL